MTQHSIKLHEAIRNKAASLETEWLGDAERMPLNMQNMDYRILQDDLADWLMDEHDMDQGDAYDLVDEVLG